MASSEYSPKNMKRKGKATPFSGVGGGPFGGTARNDLFDRSFDHFFLDDDDDKQDDDDAGAGAGAGGEDKTAWSKADGGFSTSSLSWDNNDDQHQQQQQPGGDPFDNDGGFGGFGGFDNNGFDGFDNNFDNGFDGNDNGFDDAALFKFGAESVTAENDPFKVYDGDPFAAVIGGGSSSSLSSRHQKQHQQQRKSGAAPANDSNKSSAAARATVGSKLKQQQLADAAAEQANSASRVAAASSTVGQLADATVTSPTATASRSSSSTAATVTVAVHEQLSALYDDVSNEPTCQVDGTVYVVETTTMMQSQGEKGNNGKFGSRGPFCIAMRDLMGELMNLDLQESVCQDVSDKVSRRTLHRSDRVLRVRLPAAAAAADDDDDEQKRVGLASGTRIANYTCSPTLRPVPLLVKSRVQVSPRHYRAGFKIRANPSNACPLENMAIVVAVPPHVRGDTVRMSRRGGIWDEMKRVVCWTVENLDAGEALEVQLQFECVDQQQQGGPNNGEEQLQQHGSNRRPPKFPVLVRADYPTKLFSSVEFKSDYSDGMNAPVKLNVVSSGRVLHRKV